MYQHSQGDHFLILFQSSPEKVLFIFACHLTPGFADAQPSVRDTRLRWGPLNTLRSSPHNLICIEIKSDVMRSTEFCNHGPYLGAGWCHVIRILCWKTTSSLLPHGSLLLLGCSPSFSKSHLPPPTWWWSCLVQPHNWRKEIFTFWDAFQSL